MDRFSTRQGLRQVRTVMQVDSMDQALRVGLWNLLDITYGTPRNGDQLEDLDALCQMIWWHLLDAPVDALPAMTSLKWNKVRGRFFACSWDEAYDIIEKAPEWYRDRYTSKNVAFRESANAILERHLSGYRFVDERLVPVTNEVEIEEIEAALGSASPDPAATHLAAALRLLGDRAEPDYRNSIKESVSAVEAACRQLTGDEKATLGEAVKALKKDGLHGALANAFSSLYGYTSDEGGIRHALTEANAAVDLAEARFMLVACSAFVNFVRSKS